MQLRFDVTRQANAQLRVILDLLSCSRAGGWPTDPSTFFRNLGCHVGLWIRMVEFSLLLCLCYQQRLCIIRVTRAPSSGHKTIAEQKSDASTRNDASHD